MFDVTNPDHGRNLRLVFSVSGLAVFWLLESWQLRLAPKSATPRTRHAIRNFSLAAASLLLVILPCSGLIVAATEFATTSSFGLLTKLPQRWKIPACLLLLDLWTWTWHLICHRVPLLWRFHRVHHGDPRMDVTTAYRFHPGELLLSTAVRLPLIILLGVPLDALVLYESLLLASSQFQHSDIRCGSWEQVLGLLIVTPEIHRVHHSRIPARTNSNYASVLSCWDRLFGSFSPPNDSLSTGLEQLDADHLQTAEGLLRTPFLPVITSVDGPNAEHISPK